MTSSKVLNLYEYTNNLNAVSSRNVPAHNAAAGAVNVHVYEFEITKAGQFAIAFSTNGDEFNPRIAYITVGGQRAEDAHFNAERYASLPTIDYIYNLAIPVSSVSYQYTKVLPYFLYGTRAAPVDRLKLQFSRTPGVPKNTFTINAWGKDALLTRLGSNGYPVFDHIDKFPDDDFNLNRYP
jgi:hypothetical protein